MTTRTLNTSGGLVLGGSSQKIGSNQILHAGDIGTSVQGYDALLNDISGLTLSSGQFLKYDGSNIVGSLDNNTTYTADESTLQLVSTEFSIKNQNLLDVSGLNVASNNGKIVSSNGSNLVFSNAPTSYTAGDGLGLTGGEFSVDSSVARTNANETFGANVSVTGSLSQSANTGGYWEMKLYEVNTTDETANVELGAYTSASNHIYNVDVQVVGFSSDGAESCGFHLFGLFKNVSGTLSLLGTSQQEILSRSDTGLDAVLAVSGTDINLNVTGKASTNMKWCASMKVVASPVYS